MSRFAPVQKMLLLVFGVFAFNSFAFAKAEVQKTEFEIVQPKVITPKEFSVLTRAQRATYIRGLRNLALEVRLYQTFDFVAKTDRTSFSPASHLDFISMLLERAEAADGSGSSLCLMGGRFVSRAAGQPCVPPANSSDSVCAAGTHECASYFGRGAALCYPDPKTATAYCSAHELDPSTVVEQWENTPKGREARDAALKEIADQTKTYCADGRKQATVCRLMQTRLSELDEEIHSRRRYPSRKMSLQAEPVKNDPTGASLTTTGSPPSNAGGDKSSPPQKESTFSPSDSCVVPELIFDLRTPTEKISDRSFAEGDNGAPLVLSLADAQKMYCNIGRADGSQDSVDDPEIQAIIKKGLARIDARLATPSVTAGMSRQEKWEYERWLHELRSNLNSCVDDAKKIRTNRTHFLRDGGSALASPVVYKTSAGSNKLTYVLSYKKSDGTKGISQGVTPETLGRVLVNGVEDPRSGLCNIVDKTGDTSQLQPYTFMKDGKPVDVQKLFERINGEASARDRADIKHSGTAQ